jgi:hypothetical protein
MLVVIYVVDRIGKERRNMHQLVLTRWFEDRAKPRRPRQTPVPPPRVVLCLDGDELALRPWLRTGHRSLDDELRADPNNTAAVVAAQRGNVAFACAFPPCTDLAAAGARWWRRKRTENPEFQNEAVARLRETERILASSGAPYCIFTPSSAIITKLWKSPNAVISPYQFGGYLPETHTHPTSTAIPSRDRYHKQTFLFTGNGFVLPRRKPLVPVWVLRRNKKTGKTKRLSPIFAKRKHKHARKLAPLGFLAAVARLHGNCGGLSTS